jgi:hypothetical protein
MSGWEIPVTEMMILNLVAAIGIGPSELGMDVYLPVDGLIGRHVLTSSNRLQILLTAVRYMILPRKQMLCQNQALEPAYNQFLAG